ncbi:MAG: pyruvate kinase, partial [Candidatus Nanoarchaeia archaeon]|nr:pyruvate kinase [Candidatus Nanoarchaeia archaeon]
MTRTKILATLGPSSYDKTDEMVKAGADGFRINYSHVKPEDYPFIEKLARGIMQRHENVFLVGDIHGPKLRLGDFESRKIKIGDIICLAHYSESSGDDIPFQYKGLENHVVPRNRLLIDDGKVGLRVKDIKDKKIICRVLYGDLIESR